MKKILTPLCLIALLSVLFTGCTYVDPFEKVDVFSNEMNEEVTYNQDLTPFETLVLEIDLTVSGVSIVRSEDSELIFAQKANRKELLADKQMKTSGKQMTLSFKNEPIKTMLSGSQNSVVEIKVPTHVTIKLDASINVGDLSITGEGLTLSEIQTKLNVGGQSIQLSGNQKDLSRIKLKNDVGDIRLILGGTYAILEAIETSSNVGSVIVDISGDFEHALETKADSNVGDLSFAFKGHFTEPVTGKFSASTGQVRLALPKDSPTVLETKTNEFTSNVSIKSHTFEVDGKKYSLNPSSKGVPFKLTASVNIGDLKIE